MIAAIYARKSTEPSVADEQESVAGQIDHARACAVRKGWTVDEAHIYVDDGISGAEFLKRPGFLRLMNALKPRAPFQVLVMSEESRLGREAIETAYALKQVIAAGVRVSGSLGGLRGRGGVPTRRFAPLTKRSEGSLKRSRAGPVQCPNWWPPFRRAKHGAECC